MEFQTDPYHDTRIKVLMLSKYNLINAALLPES